MLQPPRVSQLCYIFLTLLNTFVTLIAGSSASGDTLRSPIRPQRIVSMSLASDEILLNIIPQCGGYGRLAGLSTFADHPQSSNMTAEAKHVKGRVHSELETIINLRPDLVIAASFNRQEVIEALRKRSINVLTLDKFSTALDIAQNILDIGKISNCETPARALHHEFLGKLQDIDKKNQKKTRKIRVINYSPDMTLMARKTLFDDLVTRSGGINVASEKGLNFWPRLNAETLLTLQPDVVLITENDTPEKRREISRHPIWKKLSPIRHEKLVFLDPRKALSTSHFFADAVSDLFSRLDNFQN